MFNLLQLCLICILVSSPCLFAAGTRGGGDCGISFKTEVLQALRWMDSDDRWGVGHGLMTSQEQDKARAILLLKDSNRKFTLPSRLTVDCQNEDLDLDGQKVWAISEARPDGSFHSDLNENVWLQAAPYPIYRSGLVLHEELVMAGIEKTKDFHISQNLTQFGERPIHSISCELNSLGQRTTFSLKSQGDIYFTGKLSYDRWKDFDHGESGLAEHLEFAFSYELICQFSSSDPRLFACSERREGLDKLVAESVLEVGGQVVTINWGDLVRPVVNLPTLVKAVLFHKMGVDSSISPDQKVMNMTFSEPEGAGFARGAALLPTDCHFELEPTH